MRPIIAQIEYKLPSISAANVFTNLGDQDQKTSIMLSNTDENYLIEKQKEYVSKEERSHHPYLGNQELREDQQHERIPDSWQHNV